MLIDRALQRELLETLFECFPQPYDFHQAYLGKEEYVKVLANLYYLQQHELIQQHAILIRNNSSGGERFMQIKQVEISHKGIDFLLADGGLSAILGTVTIKFEQEQFKQLLEQRINEADLPQNERATILETLHQLPNDALKHLMGKMLDTSWETIAHLLKNLL